MRGVEIIAQLFGELVVFERRIYVVEGLDYESLGVVDLLLEPIPRPAVEVYQLASGDLEIAAVVDAFDLLLLALRYRVEGFAHGFGLIWSLIKKN